MTQRPETRGPAHPREVGSPAATAPPGPSPSPAAGCPVGGGSADGCLRFRRGRLTRAFENKRGGWTALSRTGDFLELANPAALCIWEALALGGTVEELTQTLAGRYPRVGTERLRRDTVAFLTVLREAGLIEEEAPGA
jgi:hypothetical protein